MPRNPQRSITSVISSRMGVLPQHLFYVINHNKPTIPTATNKTPKKNKSKYGGKEKNDYYYDDDGDDDDDEEDTYVPPVCKLLEITQFAFYWNDIVTSSSSSSSFQHKGTLSERELRRFDTREIQDSMYKIITRKTVNGSSRSIKSYSVLSGQQSSSSSSSSNKSSQQQASFSSASLSSSNKLHTSGQYIIAPFAINIWLTIPRNEDMIVLEEGPSTTGSNERRNNPKYQSGSGGGGNKGVIVPTTHKAPPTGAIKSAHEVSDVVLVPTTQPAITMDVEASHMEVEFLDNHWIQLLSVMVGFGSAGQATAYARARPKTSPLRSPKLWWKYAYNVVLEEVVSANRCYSWSFLMARRKLRIEYVGLWKHKINKTLSTGDKWRLTLLENVKHKTPQLSTQLSFFFFFWFFFFSF
jgi:hypothetical protein